MTWLGWVAAVLALVGWWRAWRLRVMWQARAKGQRMLMLSEIERLREGMVEARPLVYWLRWLPWRASDTVKTDAKTWLEKWSDV